MMNFSALTLGNHELYNDDTIDFIAHNHGSLFADKFLFIFLSVYEYDRLLGVSLAILSIILMILASLIVLNSLILRDLVRS